MAANLNPMLLEALRARVGPTTDPAIQALLASVDSTADDTELASAQAALTQMESVDPTLGLLSRLLAARQGERSDNSTEEDVDEEIAQAREAHQLALEQSERLVNTVRRLATMAQGLHSEVTQLRATNDTLARALGACYLCWGDDATCPVCQGYGRPGFEPPDAPLFGRFIVPAIRSYRAHQEETKGGAMNMSSRGARRLQDGKKGADNE